MQQTAIDWLSGLGPQSTAQEKDTAKLQKKQALLSKLSGDIDNMRERLIENNKIKVRDSQGNEQDTVNYKERDQTLEFDMDEMREGYALGQVITDDMSLEERNKALEDTGDMEKHLETKRIVETLLRQMEEATLDDGTGKKEPLFSKEDLMDEVYQPLLRQGLVGETFIPNEFSQTKKMLEGSFKEYAERLQKEEKKSFFEENKDLIFTSISSTIGGVGSGATFGQIGQGAQNSSWKPQDWSNNLTQGTASETSTIAGYVGWGFQVVSGGFDAKEDFKANNPDKDPDGRVTVAPNVAQAVVSGLASQLGGALSGAGLGVAASSAFGSVVKPGPIAKQLGGETFAKANVQTARDLIAEAYIKTMAMIDPGDDPEVTRKLTQAGAAMAAKYKTTAVDPIFAALNEKEGKKLDVGKVLKLFVDPGVQAIDAGRSLLDPLAQDPGVKDKMVKKVNKEISDDFLKEYNAQEKKSQEELEELKVVGNIKTEASKIDKKIAILKREQQALKWSANVLGLGFSIASQVLAPLAIGGAGVAIAQNLIQAGIRARDALAFIDNRKGMLNAASAYSSAIDNFVGNAELQFAHYAVNAAFQVASMIGAILQCTGILAAAGAAVSATAGSLQAVEALLYSIKKRYDLESAWKQYKLALSRPENRKLGLLALKSNPTLAKYAVAWGAVVRKDPLVKNFLNDCGLSEKNIEDDTTTHKVVEYLETRLPDDNVVVGRKIPSADFAPSPLELNAECWASAKGRGEAKAQLGPQDTRSLENALLRFKSAADGIPTKIDTMNNEVTSATPTPQDTPVPRAKIDECLKQIAACENAVAECKKLLGPVENGLNAYTPRLVDESGKNVGHHTKMQAVVDDFLGLAAESKDLLDEQVKHIQAQKDLVDTWHPA